MPVGPLLLLNGPPGIGKSTMARLLVEEHPLALCLDIDLLRRALGRWDEHPEESGLLARQLAVAAARVHLLSGHTVVIPQLVGRLPFVERLEQLARELGTTFGHIALMDSLENATARFLARSAAPGATEQHHEATAMAGGEAGLAQLYDGLLTVLAARPEVVVVHSVEGDVQGTWLRLRQALSDVL